ncbi:ribonuclease H-like domain-containing protein [Candidatus Woesearchaeota archaeon]|nr:ribonuclease H-like domain-containing protein [Candidatus Woesearchaeota archaeon]
MIRNSFIFLEKVKKRKEQSIWNQNIKNWQDFLKNDIKGISKTSKEQYNRIIIEAQNALKNDNPNFFINKLPQKEMWRLYEEFKEDCCFLDLEVDSYGRVVVVGISNYYNTNFFVKGVNLNLIQQELSKYKIVITFNGGAFDLPKLKKELKININMPHIDLKPLCVNLGLKGGLKKVEKILNLKRPKHLYGNPVELWKAFHASGDKEYLELLLDYNREDIENLKGVMNHVYRRLRFPLPK